MPNNDIRLGLAGSEILLPNTGRTFAQDYREVGRADTTASGRSVKDITAIKIDFTIIYSSITHANLEIIGALYLLKSELSLIVTRSDASTDTYTVLLQPFNRERVKSVGFNYWGGVTLELREV